MKKPISKIFITTALLSIFLFAFHKTGFICCNPAVNFDLNRIKALDNLTPVVVIGSGPAGLTAALYSSRLGYPTFLISGSMPGGQLTQTSYIENRPGEKKILGSELMEKMENQAKNLGVTFLNDKVDSVDLSNWPFKLKLSDGTSLNALSIIVATGATPRVLEVPGEREFYGKGVTTCAVCDAPFYKGKNVFVIGGGDAAAEQALQLSPYAKHVEILVRKETMRASKAMQNYIAKLDNVSISYNKEIKEILGDKIVTGVVLYDSKSKETTKLPIDGIFLAVGHDPNTQLFQSQLDMDQVGYIKLKNRSQKTSVKGVFAAGDVEDHVYRQAIVAAGSGSRAALDLDFFLQSIGVNSEIIKNIEPNIYTKELDVAVSLGEIHTKKQLDDIVSKNKPVIFDFYGDFCPPCKAMMPIFEETSRKFADKVSFIKVNTTNSEELTQNLKVIKIPCFVVFKDGSEVDRKYGKMEKADLYNWIKSFTE